MKKTLVLFFILPLFWGCTKKNLDMTLISASLPQDPIFLKWAQAQNGRWLPYALNRIKHEMPGIDKRTALIKLNMYLKPVLNARKVYKSALEVKYAGITTNFDKYLDSLYQTTYKRTNNTFTSLNFMNSLHREYNDLKNTPGSSTSKNGNVMMSSASLDSLQEYIVGHCTISFEIQNFMAGYDYILTYLSMFPTAGIPPNSCSGYLIAFLESFEQLSATFDGSITMSAYCNEATNLAEHFIWLYTHSECEEDEDPSVIAPEDPYPAYSNPNDDQHQALRDLDVDGPVFPVSASQEVRCFTNVSGATYKVSINVNQPYPNSNDLLNSSSSNKVGHTFLTLSQTNPDNSEIVRNLGYYPSGNATPLNMSDPSTFGDDTYTPYSVSLAINVSYLELALIGQHLINADADNYHLRDYNCSTVAIRALLEIGFYLPETTQLLFNGANPANLGQDLRFFDISLYNMQHPSRNAVLTTSNTNNLYAPLRTGECP